MRTEQLGRWSAGLLSVALAIFLGWLAVRPAPSLIEVSAAVSGSAVDDDPAFALDPVALDKVPFPLEHEIRRGDTLDGVLRRAGVPEAELRQASAAVSEVLDPRKLRARDSYYSMVHRDEGLVGIRLPRRGQGVVVADRNHGAWTSRYRPYRRSHIRRLVHGELRGALESSIRRAGGPANLAESMARVLQWDLDFNRDLRVGDRFEVVFDELLLDGQLQGVDQVHALRYRNRERWLEAYRFPDEEPAEGGSNRYYDGDGQPLQRQFLRSPLPYSRVTSRFSLSRFHPVLKRRMPHYGVDYGAPVGTPVRATANGTVVSAGTRGGGGRTVRLRHANGYLTAYLHLSGYAQGVRAGARVNQGQVIGYVGSSGLSTGPHLDYRVQSNGRWINPATLVSEPVPPLADALLPAFFERRDALRHELRGGSDRALRAGP
ncbi:MAG: peptidoglycan DD-metalloendopeptidase family protein [Holophagales bacterium]|nr:peptidoglycan DD-metalloendopeptidase family protein [Holophagales bacterium]MYF95469.1 peptidoglycan DD-metalloendopeptidase family protein [Holophagales bacterium]